MDNKIYTWKTTKGKEGYKFSIIEMTPRKTANKIGQYIDSKSITSGNFGSRAKAKNMAQKFVRFFKQNKKVNFSLKQ